ncbi:WEB family protein At1g75720 [Salvia hispanica]|uniref:WEB family protein At1g75720 n=1 Tax=Salvia hispanica TaxID=49212 RepID=UPI0020098820|nr:WEB family protein At1g75720 [Salvia hispanica]
MEDRHQPALDPDDQTTAPLANHRSSVDSSRPFRSVKEAVAIFGERFLVGEIYSPKTFAFPKKETPFFSPEHDRKPAPPSEEAAAALADSVKKLETELEETKAELKLLKDRESETEVALASLNAELHRNMSKMARAEAAAAAQATVGRGPSPSLAQVLSVEEEKINMLLGGKKKERREAVKKKKPIIPLVGDLFSRKKKSSSSATLHNPLYASSHLL